MPTPTPGTATYHTNISLPAGADAQTRASFTTPLEELADRTAYLRGRMNGGSAEEFVYPATKNRKLVIPACLALPSGDGAGASDWYLTVSSGVPLLIPRVAGGVAFLPIDLPSGCTITAVEVLVRSSTGRSTPDGWIARVYEQSMPWSSPGAATATQQGSSTEGGLASGYAVIAVSSLTPFIRLAEYTAHIAVTAPTGSLGSTDQLVGARVSFTDGGPRNA
jgi:hypothetical protein